MRIYVHDYAGHAFAVQLSRALAARDHTVRHGFSATNLTPQGELARQPDDPETFEPDPITTGRAVNKRATGLAGLIGRQREETAYGKAAAQRVAAFEPDVLLAANTPLDALAPIQRAARDQGAAVVNWLQDVLSVGAEAVLRRKIPVAGALVGRMYRQREGRLLRDANAVVGITEDFRPLLHDWNVPAPNIHVVENWAPLDDLPQRPQDNPWSRTHALANRTVLLYSGTLGMKHDPSLLARLAASLPDPEARVVVVSEGAGADWLLAQKAARSDLRQLEVLPFQPFDALPDVLATASVLTAILEPDASVVSVPSKVLAYLCAGRAISLAVPPDNLAARIVTREGAGLVAAPADTDAYLAQTLELAMNANRQREMGAAGRAYAERTFRLDAIADRFEQILVDAVG
ncbi:MAG: glycosyltransferase family 4 protein [Bacteroidota bacterium]